MKDYLREFLSYGSFIKPYLKVTHIIKPDKVQWGDRHQYFLYYPAQQADVLVFYLHGGGWNNGSPENFHYIGQSFALRGYHCVLLSYRKTPKHHYEDLRDDVFRGYLEAQRYLEAQGVSYQKVIVVGSSAGAQLGAVLCFDTAGHQKYQINTDAFAGYAGLAGPYSFDHCGWTLRKLLKDLFGTKDRRSWGKGEPFSLLDGQVKIPMLIIHSPHDGVVDDMQALRFYVKAVSLNLPVTYHQVREKANTHSAYCAGIFFYDEATSSTLACLHRWLSASKTIDLGETGRPL